DDEEEEGGRGTGQSQAQHTARRPPAKQGKRQRPERNRQAEEAGQEGEPPVGEVAAQGEAGGEQREEQRRHDPPDGASLLGVYYPVPDARDAGAGGAGGRSERSGSGARTSIGPSRGGGGD